jgi:hypothetical protein
VSLLILDLAGTEHRYVAGLVRAEPAHLEYSTGLVDDLDRGRPLVRVHPDDHAIALHLLVHAVM